MKSKRWPHFPNDSAAQMLIGAFVSFLISIFCITVVLQTSSVDTNPLPCAELWQSMFWCHTPFPPRPPPPTFANRKDELSLFLTCRFIQHSLFPSQLPSSVPPRHHSNPYKRPGVLQPIEETGRSRTPEVLFRFKCGMLCMFLYPRKAVNESKLLQNECPGVPCLSLRHMIWCVVQFQIVSWMSRINARTTVDNLSNHQAAVNTVRRFLFKGICFEADAKGAHSLRD